MKHLVTTQMIKGKHSRDKQRKKMLDGLTKVLNVKWVTDALKTLRDQDVWKVMIALAKEQGT